MILNVSAIIVTRNRRKMVVSAVESVLNQTQRCNEIIIVDNCSTDGTVDLLEKRYEKISNVTIVSLKTQINGNAARNIGIAKSKNEIVALLDDDDMWKTTKIAQQYKLLNPSAGVEFVYGGVLRVINSKWIHEVPAQLSGDLSKRILAGVICVTSTMMFTKHLWNKIGRFDETLTHWQEFEFSIRAFQVTKVACVPDPVSIISVNTNTKNRLTNQYDRWLLAADSVEEKHHKIIEKNAMTREFQIFKMNDAAQRLLTLGRTRQYFATNWQIFKLSPGFESKIKTLIKLVLGVMHVNPEVVVSKRVK